MDCLEKRVTNHDYIGKNAKSLLVKMVKYLNIKKSERSFEF